MTKEKKEELIKRIGNNISYLMEQQHISQNELINMIINKRGISFDQSYISAIKNGKIGHLPAVALVTICEVLNADINKVFWEQLNSEAILTKNTPLLKQQQNIVYVSKNNEFKKYLGKYYCYFYPTISDETNNGLIEAILIFSLDEQTKECVAKFNIETTSLIKSEGNSTLCKEYKGRLLLSSSYNCCYCYLINEAFGEVSFMIFDDFNPNQNNILCRMAIVITPCAGGTRDSTCHRMFLSRKKLSSEGIRVIKPHLKMNNAEILISEESLTSFFNNYNVPPKFQNTIHSLTEPENYYRLREEHFWGFDTRNMPSYNKVNFITQLREYSYSKNYQKIGPKVDKLLYQHLYKTSDSYKYFDNERKL